MQTLPPLPYSYSDLEPFIDAKTMEIHHTKHHQSYVNNLNTVFETHPEFAEMSLDELLSNLESINQDVRSLVRNNAGGHWNHSFFWGILDKAGAKSPEGALAEEINKEFVSFDNFKIKFTDVALKRFGSGWAWLVRNEGGRLEVYSTANQDCPISEGKTPLVGLDVWEHAYYLQYQNRRGEYIEAFWNILNWSGIS